MNSRSDILFRSSPADKIRKAASFHDLHTWMTSSYMTYITCYTLCLLHMYHPNTEGQCITGVPAENTHTHTHTRRVINEPANGIIHLYA